MERYSKNYKLATVYIPRNIRNPKTQNVKLGKGVPIIAHKTGKSKHFINSQTFTITQVSNTEIKYKYDYDVYTIPVSEFHKYFYLGFCITIHASQDETFNER
jgi:hypothetical protein